MSPWRSADDRGDAGSRRDHNPAARNRQRSDGISDRDLGLDLDMEADLGIDSIKRVEILGKMRDEFPSLTGLSDSAETMDALTGARTLGVIVDRMTALAKQPLGQANGTEAPPTRGAGQTPSGNGRPQHATPRRILEEVAAPLPRDRCSLVPGGRILITDDGRGVASSLAERLEAAGMAVERIGGDQESIDWTSPSAIDSVLDRARVARSPGGDRSRAPAS